MITRWKERKDGSRSRDGPEREVGFPVRTGRAGHVPVCVWTGNMAVFTLKLTVVDLFVITSCFKTVEWNIEDVLLFRWDEPSLPKGLKHINMQCQVSCMTEVVLSSIMNLQMLAAADTTCMEELVFNCSYSMTEGSSRGSCQGESRPSGQYVLRKCGNIQQMTVTV